MRSNHNAPGSRRLVRLVIVMALGLLTTLSVSGCPGDGDDDGNARDTGPDLSRDLPGDGPTRDPDMTSTDRDPQVEPQGGTVSIRVFDDGTVVTDGEAIFHAADGVFLSREHIGSDGVVTAEVPAGAMVTIGREEELVRVDMVTIAGLEGGDDIVIGEQQAAVPFEQAGSVAVTVNEAVTDADYYLMSLGYSGFGSASIATPIQGYAYQADLTDAGTVNLAAVAQYRDQRLSFATVSDISLVDGGTTSVTLPAWRMDWETFAVTGTNAPADARLLDVRFNALLDSLSYEAADDALPITAGGSTTVTLSNLVTEVSDRFGHAVGVHFGQTNYRDGYSAILRADSSRTLTVSVDLAATLLSRVYGVILNPATPDRPTITWSSAGSLASSDGMLIAVAWTDTDYVRHNWLVLAPPSTTSPFRLPQLPDDLVTWRPNVDATYVDIPWIEFVEADYIDGYGEFRAGGHDFTEVRPKDVPTGGTLRISSAGGTML